MQDKYYVDQFKNYLTYILDGSIWYKRFEYNKKRVLSVREDVYENFNTPKRKNFFDNVEESIYTNENIIQKDKLKSKINFDENFKDSIANEPGVYIDNYGDRPEGYIKLYVLDTNINELFIKHNITLKYLNINSVLYIKSIILSNDSREIDCYSSGENNALTIKKENEKLLSLSLIENTGQVSTYYIISGRMSSEL